MNQKICLIILIVMGLVYPSLCRHIPQPGKMVLVKGGVFWMGCDDDGSIEEPVHNVTLDSFLIGQYEVTQAEWKKVMKENHSIFLGDKLPAGGIDWYLAVAYCNKRSESEGLRPCYSGEGDSISCDFEADGYRLPTEAEWEYASIGGAASKGFIFSGSDNPLEVGWCERNSGEEIMPVGRLKPNELGIYDMSGNIWEWCWEWFDPEYYKTSPRQNPRGPKQGTLRSYRGGGADGIKDWLRSAGRYGQKPSWDLFNMGVRVVRKYTGTVPAGMVLVKGGEFMMGSLHGSNYEKPRHEVKVASFYMGAYEVTQREWRAVIGSDQSLFPGALNPMDSVSWLDVVDFCNRKSEKEGFTPCYSINGETVTCDFNADGYRLPTEAEWEYACKGAAPSCDLPFAGSKEPDQVGWHKGNAGTRTHIVGMLKPNELGIYDLSGNVWEWCWDWQDRHYFAYSPKDNPRGPESGFRRVVRGGGWFNDASLMRCGFRYGLKPCQGYNSVGFRLVRTAVNQ